MAAGGSGMTDETQDEINEREWRLLYTWSGLFCSYSSKLDMRLWVPKRPGTGTGYTMNFAQPGATVALAAMCARLWPASSLW